MQSEAQNTNAPQKARIWILVGLCVIAVLLWLANWYLVSEYVPSKAEQGQFGDMFGAVNALFTALAFAGLIYTVLLQRDQLALQQKDIIESGETQKKLVEKQIAAQQELFERQKAFQEEQGKMQMAHELKLEELRQTFEKTVEGHRKERETQARNEFSKNVLRAIRCELEALDELYYAGIGSDLTKTEDGSPLKVRFALSEEFYTVFNSNAVHLGKVDAQIAKQIVKVYMLVKAQIENLRINNTMLDELDRLEELRAGLLRNVFSSSIEEKTAAQIQGAGLAARKEAIQKHLVAHSHRLKGAQSALKKEFSALCSLLDAAGIN